jgi:hypothetical protein
MGMFRIELGKNLLMVESKVAWATADFSIWKKGCNEGSECLDRHTYVDPSQDTKLIERRLGGSL